MNNNTSKSRPIRTSPPVLSAPAHNAKNTENKRLGKPSSAPQERLTDGFERVGQGIKATSSSAKQRAETIAVSVATGIASNRKAVAGNVSKSLTGTKAAFTRIFGGKDGGIGFFAPKTFEFWRAVVVCFCMMTLLGHLLEIPYCLTMDSLFGIVDDSYPVWTDPWYHPYWVYGIGAVVMTLLIEPVKERIIIKRKTLWGAMTESFLIVVLLAAAMECIIGWIVNQPDPVTGIYPYWDNSQLPGNILDQAWIVNDIAIGVAAMIYIWIIYPLVCRALSWLRPALATTASICVVIGFAACCTASYWQLISTGVLG